ncbi:myb-related protein 1-like [Nicotiana tomentosiformis]|uniref:myb-related protein 1-like n=1 Tax=Nicotiana tomentosiformis TaxID=4098 RepID=UPI00388CE70A
MNVMNNYDDNNLCFFDVNVPQVEQEVDQPRLVKPRMKWTEELHESFVNAVAELGGAWEAKPRAIWRKMRVTAITLYHIKSHLQIKEVATKFNIMLPFEDQAGSSKSMPRLPQFSSITLAPPDANIYIPQPPTEATNVHVPPEMEDMVAQSIAENSVDDFFRALELAP